MPKLLPRSPTARLAIIVAAVVVFFGGGYLGARYVAWPVFKNYREKRANQVARDAYQKADYGNALLAVRKTLSYNQNNADAWRLAVEITEKQNSSDVVYYQKNLANVQPTFENQLKLLRVAVKYHALREADQVIDKIGAAGAKSPEFLELAASVSRRTGNGTKAKYYLMSLVSLQPENNKAKFDLAQIRLLEGVAENKPSIRADIRNLATDPEIRPRALALLLSDSLQSQNSSEALALADQLAAVPDTIAPNAVIISEAYRRFAPSRFKPYLTKVQAEFANDPDKVIVLTNYLVSNEQAEETRRWIDSLDEKVRSVEGVQVTYAYSLLILKDWNALETFLRGCKWDENEYARYALLAYRYRIAGREREFNESWKLAMIEVGNNIRRLQTLLAQVVSWDWQEQKFDLLWKRFMLEPTNQGVRNQLSAWEKSRGNTTALNRLFARVVELDPNDLDSKNNYAYTSLLLGINLDRAYRAANDAWKSNPKNPFYTTTQALSLYRQNKKEEALQVLESLGITALVVPERIMLHSVLLIANGRFEEGANMAMSLKPRNFLPEERRLLNDALASVQQSRRDVGSAAQLAALNSAKGDDANRKSFFRTLPAAMQESPTVQMELADSLYSSDDYKALEKNLKSDRWEDREFLRLALLSYAQKQQGDRESDARGSWRAAVASAGNSPANLGAMAAIAHGWSWQQEYIELLNRIYQRDPQDEKTFNELVDYYSKNNQTGDLARIYQLKVDVDRDDAAAKARFAYYSLLINSNSNRAYSLAKEAFDAEPGNEFRTKVYAFALYKQSRGNDAKQVLEKLSDKKETGPLQLSLVRAALAAQQNNFKAAKTSLGNFDAASALPEEAALADSIAKTVAAQDT
jgi:Tfp pilus assembly protein PilF